MLTAILAGQVLDCTGRPPIPGGMVVIEGDRIRSVGPCVDRQRDIPPGAHVIDLREETVLPGLVDTHMHVSAFPGTLPLDKTLRPPPASRVLRAAAHLLLDLRAGTTTARVLGEHDDLDFAVKNAVDEGVIPGPRILPGGKAARPTFGHGHMGTPVNGADNVRTLVRENLLRGATQIKLFVGGGVSETNSDLLGCYYTPQEIVAGVDEARRAGRPVAAHLKGGPGVRLCVEAGVDSIEHGYLLTDDDMALMQAHGTWLGATPLNLLHPRGMSPATLEDPTIAAKYRTARESLRTVYRKAVQNGLRWVTSSDARHGYLPHGVLLMVELGATPMDAILSVTRWPAELARVADTAGTLEPSKYADIISVRGNPLEDPSAMTRVHLVMKGGRRYDTEDLFGWVSSSYQ